MKICNNIKMLMLGAGMLAGAFGCTKVETEGSAVDGRDGEMIFKVSSAESGTKALIGTDGFKTAGNTIRVYDAWSTDGFTTSYAYIPGQYAVCNGAGTAIWPFSATSGSVTGDVHYYWSKTGTHRFYSVMDYDAASKASAPAGWGFDSDNKVYSVPQSGTYETSPSSGQFDMLYSNVIERDIDAGDSKSAVALQFSHLFSAYAFTFHNDSPNGFVLRNVVLKTRNVGKATVDYSKAWDADGASAAEVDYYESEQSMNPTTGIQGIAGSAGAVSTGSEYTVAADGKVNLFLADKSYSTDAEFPDTDYTLVWPQDLNGETMEIDYDMVWTETTEKTVYYYTFSQASRNGNAWGYVPNFVEKTGGAYVQKSGSTSGRPPYSYKYYEYVGPGKGAYSISGDPSNTTRGNVVYSRGTTKETITEQKTKTMTTTVDLSTATDGGRWDAGKKYLYNLSYSNNEVGLTVSVMYWNGGHGGDVTFE